VNDAQWFVAVRLVRCRVGEHQYENFLCDQQIRLIQGLDHEGALEKALLIGAAEEHHYLNEDGETVYWEFVGIVQLEELETLHDGLEIHSSFIRSDEPAALVDIHSNAFRPAHQS